MQLVRQHLEGKLIPQPAIDTIMNIWRLGTRKQYGVYIKRWQVFCAQHDIDMGETSIVHVLEFLQTLVQSGLGYSAVNTARGALTALLTVSKRNTVGCHPLVVRFMKGIFESNPPPLPPGPHAS